MKKEKFTREQARQLMSSYTQAIGTYVEALNVLGVHSEDIRQIVLDLAAKKPTRRQAQCFIEGANAAMQAANDLRNRQNGGITPTEE